MFFYEVRGYARVAEHEPVDECAVQQSEIEDLQDGIPLIESVVEAS